MPKTNNDQFKELVMKSDRTRKEIADLLGVSLETVHNWLRPPDNKGFREVKAVYVEILKIKLQD